MGERAEGCVELVVCSRCGLAKGGEEFGTRGTHRISSECKDCRNARARKWRAANPLKHKWSRDNYRASIRTSPKRKIEFLVNRARGRAQSKGIEFSISREWIERYALDFRCAVTGIEFRIGIKVMNPFSPSIDRIDPSIGYTDENSRLVLMGYNALKGTGTDADVLEIAMAITKCTPR